ncbi:unnamed protein product [Rotaria sp. Silwood2]|nr:unnamed protein product [Rotaria sp. Silwood2]
MIDLENYEGIDKVKQYFDQSNDANDPKYILKAYTEQTGFYQRLNRTLARSHELNPNDGNQHQLLDFLNLICCHPSFRNYEFQDQAYRGMRMDAEDLKQYDIGAKIMMKSLIKFEKLTQHYIQYLL